MARMRQFTHGSLFAGIGGFDLGFERAGFKTVWQVEIDEYCRRVLERHFPEALRFEDVRACAGFEYSDRAFPNVLPAVDVVSGGFPCQDISNAGNCEGITGARSGLWTHMLRIVHELRPRLIVVENVAALLRRGVDTVLGDLAEIGYDAIWDCIPASTFGAPHCRDRIWIIAYPEQSGLATDLLESRRTINQGAERARNVWEQWWLHEPSRLDGRWMDAAGEARNAAAAWEHAPYKPLLLGIPDGISKRVERIGAIGNAVVPQIAEWIALRIKAQLEKEEIGAIK